MKIICFQKTGAKFWGENLLSVYITYSGIQVFYVLVSRFLFSVFWKEFDYRDLKRNFLE